MSLIRERFPHLIILTIYFLLGTHFSTGAQNINLQCFAGSPDITSGIWIAGPIYFSIHKQGTLRQRPKIFWREYYLFPQVQENTMKGAIKFLFTPLRYYTARTGSQCFYIGCINQGDYIHFYDNCLTHLFSYHGNHLER